MAKQLLSKKQVREKVGVSFAQMDRWENELAYAHLGFPKRIRVGFRVFWLAEEIDDFIDRLVARHRTPE
jgi:predicted DNA-binding transcriptional regulator AlpA